METAVIAPSPVSHLNGDVKEPLNVMEELQKQRDSLKQNLQEMDKDIKKLTGRDHVMVPRRGTAGGENRRSSIRRVPLKRESLGVSGGDPPHKRRWGNTAFNNNNNNNTSNNKTTNQLDSGGEEKTRKPTIQSSVVVTAKATEEAPVVERRKEDVTMKKRNKRMFGLLLGTLKQFKQDSQMKTETESKQEEKLIQVEEKVQREKEEIIERKKDLIETRQGKKLELEELEFKIAMTELNQELKTHYDQFTDFIQLRSTPCIFYKPALHNDKTEKLLKESQARFNDSLQNRMKEISMCTEEDIQTARVPWENDEKNKSRRESGRLFHYDERTGKQREGGRRRRKSGSGGKSVMDPIVIDRNATSRKNPITVDDDDDVAEVTVIENTTTEEEDNAMRSVVVDKAEPTIEHPDEEVMNKDDEFSYAEFDDHIGGDIHVDPVITKEEEEEKSAKVKSDDETKERSPDKKPEQHVDEEEKEGGDEMYEPCIEGEENRAHTVESLMESLTGVKEHNKNDEEPAIDEEENCSKEDSNELDVHVHSTDYDVVDEDELQPPGEELPMINDEQNISLTDVPTTKLDQTEDSERTEDNEQCEIELPLEEIQLPPEPSDTLDTSIYDTESCKKDVKNVNSTDDIKTSHGLKDDDIESRNIFTDLLPAVHNNENSTDDFEYAEQLLEQVVDKERSIISPSSAGSYSVIDERVFSKSNETFGSDITDPADISLFSKEYSAWQEG